MTWPTAVTVTGTWLDCQGNDATGTVTFQASGRITNGTQGFRQPDPIVATLSSGAISQALNATDDTATLETGTYYTVTEAITGCPVRSYTMLVPHAGGSISLMALPAAA